MATLKDTAGRLTMALLSIDDLVVAQQVGSASREQVELAGRTALGTAAVGFNLAVRALQLGVQAGAATTRAASAAVEGLVPGAGVARAVATEIGKSAGRVGTSADRLASFAVTMTLGEDAHPRDPITGNLWLQMLPPSGTSWSDLFARSFLEPLLIAARLPLSVTREALSTAVSNRLARRAISGSWNTLNALLDSTPGGGSAETAAERRELRSALLAIGIAPAWSSLSDLLSLADATARLATGDGEALNNTVRQVLGRMQQPFDAFALPHDTQLGNRLRKNARVVADNIPTELLAALETDADNPVSRFSTVAQAAFSDNDRLRAVTASYSMLLAMIGFDLARTVIGLTEVGEIDGYLETGAGKKPWPLLELEDLAGSSAGGDAAGFVPRELGQLSQDAAFAQATRLLGRKEALSRVGHQWGSEVRERIELDPSLRASAPHAVMASVEPSARADALRSLIAEGLVRDPAELSRTLAAADERLASLLRVADWYSVFTPASVTERIEVLRDFVSFGTQELALYEAPGEEAERLKVLDEFLSWRDRETESARGVPEPSTVS